ncbi:hypothetical protein ACOMHN_021346 [Nucella lapillus]
MTTKQPGRHARQQRASALALDCSQRANDFPTTTLTIPQTDGGGADDSGWPGRLGDMSAHIQLPALTADDADFIREGLDVTCSEDRSDLWDSGVNVGCSQQSEADSQSGESDVTADVTIASPFSLVLSSGADSVLGPCCASVSEDCDPAGTGGNGIEPFLHAAADCDGSFHAYGDSRTSSLSPIPPHGLDLTSSLPSLFTDSDPDAQVKVTTLTLKDVSLVKKSRLQLLPSGKTAIEDVRNHGNSRDRKKPNDVTFPPAAGRDKDRRRPRDVSKGRAKNDVSGSTLRHTSASSTANQTDVMSRGKVTQKQTCFTILSLLMAMRWSRLPAIQLVHREDEDRPYAVIRGWGGGVVGYLGGWSGRYIRAQA